MPHSKSAKKRMRQATTHREAHRVQRAALRTMVKKVRTAESGGEAEEAFRKAQQLLDRAARKRLIHPNAASRTKARLRMAIEAKTD